MRWSLFIGSSKMELVTPSWLGVSVDHGAAPHAGPRALRPAAARSWLTRALAHPHNQQAMRRALHHQLAGQPLLDTDSATLVERAVQAIVRGRLVLLEPERLPTRYGDPVAKTEPTVKPPKRPEPEPEPPKPPAPPAPQIIAIQIAAEIGIPFSNICDDPPNEEEGPAGTERAAG